MRYYLAPLEGTTGYIYRNAVRDCFGEGIDKYFTPFIAPHPKRAFSPQELADVFPENNRGLYLVPQILTSSAADYLRFEKAAMELGYREININMGCPSGTVASKGRGSGFLARPEELERFLDEVFAKASCRVSVKTRIGSQDPEEFPRLLEIYNRYAMEELIIHPRVRREMYTGTVHMDVYRYAQQHSRNRLCYNGDIVAADGQPYPLQALAEPVQPEVERCKGERSCGEGAVREAAQLSSEAEGAAYGSPAGCSSGAGGCATAQTEAVMVGRGMVADPSLIRQLRGGAPASREEFTAFLMRLREDYTAAYSGERNVLHRLKEIWAFMGPHYPKAQAELKTLMKAESLEVYKVAARRVLQTMEY